MIITKDLILRRFRPSDWRDLHEYLCLPEVVRYEPYSVMSREKCMEIAAYRTNSKEFFAVCLKESQKMIGNLYISKKMFGTWEIGYVFNPSYQNKGYATQSVIGLLTYMIHHKGARKFVAMCSPLNQRSQKLLERIGMARDMIIKKNVSFEKDERGNPIFSDSFRYSVTKDQWRWMDFKYCAEGFKF